MALTYALGIKHGFGFSAGLIDYLLNMGLATNGWMLIPVGLAFGVVYFILFYFIIKAFNLKTPGREDADNEEIADFIDSEDIITSYAEALGGLDNLVNIDSCITRLRLEVKDAGLLDESKLKLLGSKGVIKLSSTAVQVIIGSAAEQIANGLKKLKK